jgi:hypothetical protein
MPELLANDAPPLLTKWVTVVQEITKAKNREVGLRRLPTQSPSDEIVAFEPSPWLARLA